MVRLRINMLPEESWGPRTLVDLVRRNTIQPIIIYFYVYKLNVNNRLEKHV